MNAPIRAGEFAAPRIPALAPQRSLLRFITCGSVDDGKSTLIGRMLYEAGAVPDDQITALDSDSARHSTTGGRDYALLVDGLVAEREQGITIDVAYRYFGTSCRAFIVADTPGHEQYTRNMATGASTADLAVILIDASKGVLPQTRRHAFIASMLGIKHVILAVNKMDLVGYAESRFREIEADAQLALASLGFVDVIAIPVAARHGENIAKPGVSMPWYRGLPLLSMLEGIEITREEIGPFRFPVQWVSRPNENFRGFAGLVASGRVRVGETVRALPSGQEAAITRIALGTRDTLEAREGEAPILVLDREIDISRGDVIVASNDETRAIAELRARLLWMSGQSFDATRRYRLKLASAEVNLLGLDLEAQIDIHSFSESPSKTLGMNTIARVALRLDRAVIALPHAENRALGTFILIDAVSGETAALGVVETSEKKVAEPSKNKRGWLGFLRNPSGEGHQRSVLKALTWRATGSADTFLLSWLFTQSAKVAAVISITEIATKIVLYYLHERAWARSAFGLSPKEATR
ncbi:MAG: GTP-binding protein [Rhabdaerophilum sp.]